MQLVPNRNTTEYHPTTSLGIRVRILKEYLHPHIYIEPFIRFPGIDISPNFSLDMIHSLLLI